MKTKIYALLDENNNIRYIGKTIRKLSRRFSQHLSVAKANNIGKHHCSDWIRSMISKGFLPKIQLIGEVNGDGCKEEIAWISYGLDECWKLTNSTFGGEGNIPTDLTRMKMRLAHLGKPNPNKGKSWPQEMKNKISNTLKKKYKIKEIINPNLGKILCQELKDKISNTLKEKYKIGEIKSAVLGKHWTLPIEIRNKMGLSRKGVKRGKYKIS